MNAFTFNGALREIPDDCTVSEMLELFGYKRSKASVWIDGKQLMLSEYDFYTVPSGGTVKVLRILGGG